MPDPKNKNPFNIPNSITLVRLILVPLCVYLINQKRLTEALIVFGAAGISDGVDGFLARYLDQRTKLGAFIDPLADKLLLVSSYITLSLNGLAPFFPTLIIVLRDVMILSGIAKLYVKGIRFEIKPKILSKATTFFQLITVIIVLLYPDPGTMEKLKFYSFAVTCILTLVSGAEYFIIGLMILKKYYNKI